MRTRGSIKRRPPSRKFRRSLSDYGDGEDLGNIIPSPENGTKEDGDEVFEHKGKTEEAETGNKEIKKQTVSDEKPPSRRGSSISDNEDKEEKQVEEVTPYKSNTGDTEKEEEVCCGAPGENNSPQSPSEDKEDKVCEAPQEKEEEGGACEQEKGDKEKEETEEKETSENTVTRRTSDTEETPLAPQPLQEAVGLETASEPLTSALQEQGTE